MQYDTHPDVPSQVIEEITPPNGFNRRGVIKVFDDQVMGGITSHGPYFGLDDPHNELNLHVTPDHIKAAREHQKAHSENTQRLSANGLNSRRPHY